jgi:transposase
VTSPFDRESTGVRRHSYPISAAALVAEIGDWKAFGSGRSLAAWMGLVPKQYTTGGKDKPNCITKQGNRYLQWLLVVGAMAVIRYSRTRGTEKRPWLGRLMERRPTKVAAVALANKIADGLGHHGPG